MAYVEVDADRRVKIVSWGSVIAGAVTVLSVSLLLSLLAGGLGLGQVDADASNPLDGVGATFGWSSALFLLISLAAGGYVAGYLSGVGGWIHGFLTWAVAMLVAAWLSISALGGIINTTGSVLGGAANVTGSAAQAATTAAGGATDLVGSAVSTLASTVEDQIFDDLDVDIRDQLAQAARQTDLAALEPQLIEDQVAGARADLAQAGQALVLDPTSYGTIIDELLASLRERAETLSAEINRDDVVAAIAANTTLSDAQVEEAADRVIALHNGLASEVRDQVSSIDENVAAAQEGLLALQNRALEQAERAADAASGAALWAFFGGLIGAGVAIGAGVLGTRSPVALRSRF